MTKITTKAALTLGTNYLFHLVDFQGTDIAVDATGNSITSTTTDFTASSQTGGIVKRPIEVDDRIVLSNTGSPGNEAVELTVTAVTANSISYTVLSGVPVDEAAGADINVTAFRKTYQFLEAGGLSFVDGVQGQTWVSEVVDQWDAGDLDIYPKMFTSIEPRAKSMACLNGWEPHDNDTLKAIRDTALEIRDTATAAARRVYALARSDSLDAPTDQFTFWPDTDAPLDAPRVAVTTGFVNELFLIVDTDNGIDDRGVWTFRCLEPGKTHVQQPINIQFAEIVPVASNNALDPKLADGAGALLVGDAVVAAGGIYANILLNVDSDEQYDGDVNGSLFSFTGSVDADGQSNEDAHFKVHYLLRQPTNINSDGSGPVLRGDKSPPVTSFLGDIFFLQEFYLLNFSTIQRNNLRLVDGSGDAQLWPTIFTLTITAPQVAVGGTMSIMHADTFAASGPTYLDDEASIQQKDVSISSLIDIVVAYSTYSVDGHTAGTPIPLVLSYNRPGFIEPDHINFTMGAANQTVNVVPVADPSYAAA